MLPSIAFSKHRNGSGTRFRTPYRDARGYWLIETVQAPLAVTRSASAPVS